MFYLSGFRELFIARGITMDGFANVLVAEDDYDNAIDLVREYDNSAEQADASEAGADKVTDYKPWLA
ncbi:hypothetical protein [Pseudohongiella acticola]|mgnify:CR=1 FL=1|uniref:hypothetical protein n=1 Tax=Pseudohongiella acticola TaxID=1524254 RepID=UPI0030EB5974